MAYMFSKKKLAGMNYILVPGRAWNWFEVAGLKQWTVLLGILRFFRDFSGNLSQFCFYLNYSSKSLLMGIEL